ncbi:MAG: phosphatidylcholine/phosphatidylserine synthase [Phycisphaeraceae bacterium]
MPESERDAEGFAQPKPVRMTRRRKAALKAIAVLPTLFTLGNLLCGFFAIFIASRDPLVPLPFGWSPLTFAAMAVFLGMVFDAIDGRIARLTNQTSELGEQLDSFADMVSFGVAPAFIGVMLIDLQVPFLESTVHDTLINRAVLMVGGLYVACAALRLARFNVEIKSPAVSDHTYFKGLPSPGAAGTVVSFVLLHEHFLAPLMREHRLVEKAAQTVVEPWPLWLSKIGMIAVMFLVALAMVSRLRYVHVMNKYFRGKANLNFIVLILISFMIFLIEPQVTIVTCLLLYGLSAPLAWTWYKTFGKKGQSLEMWVPDEDDEDEEEEPAAE